MVGRGCAVVDPHGDLAKDVLGSLVSSGYFSDESVYDWLMYVAPRRRDYIIPFNVLSSPDPDTETYEIAQRVISAYMRTWAQMGKIPHTRIGRNIRIRESDLKKWLDAHRIEGDKRMIQGLFPLQLQ